MRAILLFGCVLFFACGDDTDPAAGGGGSGGASAGGAPDGGGNAGGTGAQGGGAQGGGAQGGAGGENGDGGAGGAAGDCDETAFVGGGIAQDGWSEGDFCDSVTTCVPSEAMASMAALFDEMTCKASGDCDNLCTLHTGGTITADELAAFCSASVIEGISSITCLVLGP